MSDVIDAVAVDAALKQFTDMMATDGYVLSWSATGADRIAVRIEATEAACADCLVPQPVMQAIMSAALESTPYTVDSVELPGGGH